MITLHHKDCLEVLATLPNSSINLILQDPPYNTTACSWEWDIFTQIDTFWYEWKRVLTPNGVVVMTASQPFTSKLVVSNLPMFKYEFVWDKVIPRGHLVAKKRPMQQTESLLVFYAKAPTYNPQMVEREKPIKGTEGKRTSIMGGVSKGYSKVYTHKYPTNLLKIKPEKEKLHPTQKPVDLMSYIIKTYTNENDVVFDGFMGSGTVGVACKKLSRQFIGCELNHEYFEIAKTRIYGV